ncbi:MAG TPA: hypothetical protein VK658_13985 [Chryseolinea sp.]|nr:hypothetical protein [Chryseolinea sp.]
MRNSFFLAGLVLIFAHTLKAQDEGTIVKRDRIERDKSIYLALGPSFTLGKNIGDYSAGFSIEAGLTKRMNRIFSIGPSLSFVRFDYDPAVTEAGNKNTFIGGPFTDQTGTYYEGLYIELTGGDISLTSLAVNLKLNIVPIKDNTKFSFYAFAKPFVAYSTRSEVIGDGYYLRNYDDIENADDWITYDEFDWTAGNAYVKSEYNIDVSQDMKKESKVTGGIYIGPGVELFPTRPFSAFLQVAIGYTFPITYVSTEYYNKEGSENNLQTIIINGDIEKYPMLKKGFPSIGVQFGASYNF